MSPEGCLSWARKAHLDRPPSSFIEQLAMYAKTKSLQSDPSSSTLVYPIVR